MIVDLSFGETHADLRDFLATKGRVLIASSAVEFKKVGAQLDSEYTEELVTKRLAAEAERHRMRSLSQPTAPDQPAPAAGARRAPYMFVSRWHGGAVRLAFSDFAGQNAEGDPRRALGRNVTAVERTENARRGLVVALLACDPNAGEYLGAVTRMAEQPWLTARGKGSEANDRFAVYYHGARAALDTLKQSLVILGGLSAEEASSLPDTSYTHGESATPSNTNARSDGMANAPSRMKQADDPRELLSYIERVESVHIDHTNYREHLKSPFKNQPRDPTGVRDVLYAANVRKALFHRFRTELLQQAAVLRSMRAGLPTVPSIGEDPEVDLRVRLREWCVEAIPIWEGVVDEPPGSTPDFAPSGDVEVPMHEDDGPLDPLDIDFHALHPGEAKKVFARILQNVIFAGLILTGAADSRRDAQERGDRESLPRLREREKHFCGRAERAVDIALQAVERVDPSHKPRRGRAPCDIAAELLPVLSRLRGLLAINHSGSGIDKYTDQIAELLETVGRLRFEVHTLMFDDPPSEMAASMSGKFIEELEELLTKHGLLSGCGRLQETITTLRGQVERDAHDSKELIVDQGRPESMSNSSAAGNRSLTSKAATAIDGVIGPPDWQPASWFAKKIATRLRKAVTEERKTKVVRRETVEGVYFYNVSDVRRHWSGECIERARDA